jgi:hypothetical protein
MLYAILICTDEACAEEFEAWGEPDELDSLVCECCDCVLQPLAFCEVSTATVLEMPRRTPYVQQRRAA